MLGGFKYSIDVVCVLWAYQVLVVYSIIYGILRGIALSLEGLKVEQHKMWRSVKMKVAKVLQTALSVCAVVALSSMTTVTSYENHNMGENIT